jgi:hypothetical protein
LVALSAPLAASQVALADTKQSGWLGSAGQSLDGANPRFKLDVPTAQTVTIDLKSSADPYLYLLDETGSTVLFQDDDSGGNHNSRLSVALGAGKYQLVAATHAPGQQADFTLSTAQNGGGLHTCFVAYANANYGGTSNVICDGSEPILNDTYSSLRVPKGLALRVYDNSNLTGLARTYFYDTPWVGNLYNDMMSGFTWWDFSTDDFFMTTVSDTQFPWSYCSDSSSSSLCAQEKGTYPNLSLADLSHMYNGRLQGSLNSVKDSVGAGRFGGTIINGDLTAFGDQGSDKSDYISYYEHGLSMNVYLGLGNHDYANNVDDCGENQCASQMVWYLNNQVTTLNPVRFDYSESGAYYSFPSIRKDYSGSLGYSWEIGNVHFVQLNNYPVYARSWNGWNFGAARRDYINISSAISWLRSDLADATSRGKKIILNWHDWDEHVPGNSNNPDILAVLNDFPVSAVFCGHFHGSWGEFDRKGPFADGKSVPVLLSGSAHYGTFLLTRYTDTQMYVWVMQADPWNNGALHILYPDDSTKVDVSDLASKLDVSPGAPRYYRYVYDLR